MDLRQYAELFLTESREHLSAYNQLLLAWERDPGSPEPVTGIFRAVHTIKGMAATMGYSRVADLAHRTENLLDLIRRGAGVATDETMQLLFRAADALERVVEAAVAGDEATVDITAVADALDQAATALEPPVGRRSRPSIPMVMPALGEGRRVRVVIRREAPLKGARALLVLRRLEGIGTVGAVEPAPIAFESDEFDGEFAVRIETPQPADVIEREIRAAGEVATVTFDGEDAAAKGEAAASRVRHIRVDLRRLDALMNLIGELVTAKGLLTQASLERGDTVLDGIAVKVAQLTGALQSEIIQARMTPVWQVFDRFPRLVRDLARQLGKQVAFRVEGKEIELDRAILDEIGDPLVHLLRNAVDHGLETAEERVAAGKPAEGQVVVTALRERATVAIQVSDDGRGIDRAAILATAKELGLVDEDATQASDDVLLRVLARPGFSTAEEVSDVSGRGVGIDVVATRLRAVGGSVEVRSTPGKGTTFTLRLPTTLAIVRALLTDVGAERYALPLTHVTETVAFARERVTRVDGRDAMLLRDQVLPLVHLRDVLRLPGEAPPQAPVIVLQIGDRRVGVVVDAMVGQQEIVVKGFDAPRGMLPIFSGATIMGDGAPVLILDAGGLV